MVGAALHAHARTAACYLLYRTHTAHTTRTPHTHCYAPHTHAPHWHVMSVVWCRGIH
jgi:hypothetical protein